MEAQPYPRRGGYSAAEAGVEERSGFLVRTYLHLVGAIIAFLVIETGLVVSGVAHTMLEFIAGGSRFIWLIFLGAFMVVSHVADRWARSDSSIALQYAGLAFYTVAEALLFAPLVMMAVYVSMENGTGAGGILMQAGAITGVLFVGLTGIVFITRNDFSFLKGVLMWGGMAALALIGSSMIFGFQLGVFFSWAMVAFAGASILYNTSNVLHHYRVDQHVAASLSLFASVMLLLWYVIQILMRRD